MNILVYIAGMNAFEMDAMSANDINVMVYVCQNCGKGFQNGAELAEHNLIKHTSAKDKALNCNISMSGISSAYTYMLRISLLSSNFLSGFIITGSLQYFTVSCSFWL